MTAPDRPLTPGVAGTATVRGVEGVRVMRGGDDGWFISANAVHTRYLHPFASVTDFTPDPTPADVEALRGEVERLRVGMDGAKGNTDRMRRKLVTERDEARTEKLRLQDEVDDARAVIAGVRALAEEFRENAIAIRQATGDVNDGTEFESAADMLLHTLDATPADRPNGEGE